MEQNSLRQQSSERNPEETPTVGTNETALERLAERSARAIGSVESLAAHSVFFVGIFVLLFFGFSFDQILLLLTTVVSLEAIYLAIFIQMTVNRHSENIEEVQKDIDDIQDDVEDISEDIEDIGEDVEGIQKDVKEIGDDVEDIQKDVDNIHEDVEDISEDINRSDDDELTGKETTDQKLEKIEESLQSLVRDIERLRRER